MLYAKLRSKLFCERVDVSRFRSFDAAYEGRVLQVHTYVPAGFRHFPHESTRNSCLDSSAQNHAENLSASAWISASVCTGKSRNSSEKCKLSVSSTVCMYRLSTGENQLAA